VNLPERRRHRRRSFAARITLVFLVLLLAVQVVSFSALRFSLVRSAHRKLPVTLANGARVFSALIERKAQALAVGAELLAADDAIRRDVLASQDDDTIRSAVKNHGRRIGATLTAYLDSDFGLRVTTHERPQELAPLVAQLAARAAELHLGAPPMAGASARNFDSPRASAIALVGTDPFLAVLVPVMAPRLRGWVLMAFPVDAQLRHDVDDASDVDLTLLTRVAPREPWSVRLTTLKPAAAAALARHAWTDADTDQGMQSVLAMGEELGVHALPLGADRRADKGVLALVSLSVDDAVRLPADLQVALIVITLAAIAVFAAGSVVMARRVTTPLRGLVDAAERLGAGDYATPMHGLAREDEVGDLSQSFERMRVSIAENQAQVLRLAYWDSLTGLPNRARFREACAGAIRGAATEQLAGGVPAAVAVIMLDLNRFKHVNDVLGYSVGDQVLVGIAERLGTALARDGDVVARLSGDEFGVLLRGADLPQAQAVALRIEQALEQPLAMGGHKVDMGAGIGIACWPQHADDHDTLLVRAEMAMYAAKRRSNGPVAYDPAIDATSAQTLTLISELRQAVDRGELRLYLQPKLALDDRAVVGAEALVRWQHPLRGLVPPAQFIPFAEQTGFIRILTMWVFEEAARHWQALAEEGLQLRLSVNLSTRDLLDLDLPQKFAALLARHGVPAAGFCLEITESAIMDDPQRALATLDALSAMGFKLSIDDFGTGYSSLAYLKRLPVDELKIDQSFVRNMQSDRDDEMIVRSTIDLAHNLGIMVVAEGVETAAAWNLLRELKCDQAQGYHMGRPMPVGEFSAWSAGWGMRRTVDDGDGVHLLH
jgi:diguanylate cyclase (GGDEF)-like protein